MSKFAYRKPGINNDQAISYKTPSRFAFQKSIRNHVRFLVEDILGEYVLIESTKGAIVISDTTMNIKDTIIIGGEDGVSVVGDDTENKITISVDIDDLVDKIVAKLPVQIKQNFSMTGGPSIPGGTVDYTLSNRVIANTEIVILNGQVLKQGDDYLIETPADTSLQSTLKMKTHYGTPTDPANIIIIYQS